MQRDGRGRHLIRARVPNLTRARVMSGRAPMLIAGTFYALQQGRQRFSPGSVGFKELFDRNLRIVIIPGREPTMAVYHLT